MDVVELASLVMDWFKADREIARSGWDGGEKEQAWESAAKKMVVAASSVIHGTPGKERPDEDNYELRVIHDMESENGVSGIGLRIVPASDSGPGYAELRMIGTDTGGAAHDTLSPIRLNVMDIGKIASVLNGIETRVELHSRIDTVLSKEISVFHADKHFMIEVSVCGDWPHHSTVGFKISPSEAYVIARTIEGSLPRMAFGK